MAAPDVPRDQIQVKNNAFNQVEQVFCQLIRDQTSQRTKESQNINEMLKDIVYKIAD